MYADNARNRMLSLILAVFMVMSLGFNVKQLFDVRYYQQIASETQDLLQSMVPASVIPKLAVLRTMPVNQEELRCMAENIYYEAATQSLVGKMAVGHVVLNRMASPRYPKTACGVVNQKVGEVCMFSWKCESHKEIRDQKAWKQSQQVAYDLLSRDRKDIVDITEGATHFHAVGLKTDWKLKKVTKIDDHLFYK